MNIFVIMLLVICVIAEFVCLCIFKSELDDRNGKLRILEHLHDNEQGRTRSLERSAIDVLKERDKYRGLVKELKDEITELKLERYKNISSYYKRNGGVEDG